MTDAYIRTSYATAHCAVATTGVTCIELRSTDKATEFQVYDEAAEKYRTFWLPKKALKLNWSKDGINGYELAKWFKVEGYVKFVFERCVSSLVTTA